MDSIDYFLGVINADEMSEDEDEEEEEPEANWSLSILNPSHIISSLASEEADSSSQSLF